MKIEVWKINKGFHVFKKSYYCGIKAQKYADKIGGYTQIVWSVL